MKPLFGNPVYKYRLRPCKYELIGESRGAGNPRYTPVMQGKCQDFLRKLQLRNLGKGMNRPFNIYLCTRNMNDKLEFVSLFMIISSMYKPVQHALVGW